MGAHLKARAIERTTRQLQRNLEIALQHYTQPCHETSYGMGCAAGRSTMDTADAAAPPSAAAGEQASEYTTTNVAEEGVDEADFVKNDGRTIYLLAGRELRIYRAWPPESTSLLSRLELTGLPKAMYVGSDRALVYAQDSGQALASDRFLEISVIDLSDLSHPVLEQKLRVQGTLVSSRRIGQAVFTVVQSSPAQATWRALWPDGLRGCGQSEARILETFAALREEITRELEQTEPSRWVPLLSESVYQADGSALQQSSPLVSCADFLDSEAQDGGFTTVLSLSLADPDARHQTTIAGASGTVYASAEALYLARPYWHQVSGEGLPEGGAAIREATALHKLSLSSAPLGARYQGSGLVEGWVLNQFSLSEHQGFLRVATTTRGGPAGMHSSVFVLSPVEDRLEVVGGLGGIAPTEDIRSVRFLGERGFVVTFKKTDPLFALDLSDPRNPRIRGELKIPGFSTYIHPMDEDHLLTIGFDADDQGRFAWFQGIQLQIFDVSDLSRPTLLHKALIGTRGTSSEATADHLAFTYFAPRGLLALPMAVCQSESSLGGGYSGQPTFDGLMVFAVHPDTGIAELGRVSHASSDGTLTAFHSCDTWWQGPASRVQRSIILGDDASGDFLFSLSLDQLKITSAAELTPGKPTTPLLTLPLPFLSPTR